MIELDWEIDRTEGVTLVSATVATTATTPQRVRIDSRLDGPIWPPVRGSDPAAEWTDSGWNGIVAPNQRRGIGFASHAAPVEPPIEAVSARRATIDRSTNAADALASLTAWKPTTDVLERQQ
ncbi:hypothetical protein HYG81_06525 [Natrinema zhouii]|uniref:Uncharacterized protein n=1 Tax=Natrinema zhouii TaxID=1710539 RepID=A0A7D6CT11_9EURY|nr:hypothetical protein [Natrinema zhouii]QLK27253.1 hypothetical protein HYG81_06525 [Natrinema zhouii]